MTRTSENIEKAESSISAFFVIVKANDLLRCFCDAYYLAGPALALLMLKRFLR